MRFAVIGANRCVLGELGLCRLVLGGVAAGEVPLAVDEPREVRRLGDVVGDDGKV